MRNNNTPAGFTIVELLVAAAVFVTVVVIVVDLFLLFLRDNFQQAKQEQLEQSISYVYYQISGRLHSDLAIDYSRYDIATNPNPQTELYFINRANLSIGTIILGTGIPTTEKAGQVYYKDITKGTTEPLTPDPVTDVYVDSLQFFVYPSTDPANVTTGPIVNNQPAIVLRVTAHAATDNTVTATYQTLITSRYYAR